MFERGFSESSVGPESGCLMSASAQDIHLKGKGPFRNPTWSYLTCFTIGLCNDPLVHLSRQQTALWHSSGIFHLFNNFAHQKREAVRL